MRSTTALSTISERNLKQIMSPGLFFCHATVPNIQRRVRFSSSFTRVYRPTSSSAPSYSNFARLNERRNVKSNYIRNTHAIQTAQGQQSVNKSFDWFNQWYPVALLADLDERKPNAQKVLGTDLVVWRVPERRTWTVFRDRCPHRFAALSEGRVNRNTGTLECGYHGWQFDSDGTCSVIPQSPKAPSALACATTLPSFADSGLLFVWMGTSAPPLNSRPHVIDDVRAKYITSAYSRILPLCFTTLIQNILDPAHIHFAHHGQIGRRELAAPIPVRVLKPQTSQGFIADYYDGSVRLRFRPPCLIEIVTSKGVSFAYYAVPLSSGLVRTFALRGTSRRPLFRIPKWIDHIQRNRLVEGDLQLMISQQRQMRKATKNNDYTGSWGDFYMPTSSDRLIVEMKRWLEQNAPPESCDWFAFEDDSNVKAYISRLNSHTNQCTSCSNLRSRLMVSEGVAGSLAVAAIICSMTTSTEAKLVSSSVVGFSWFLFVVSRGLRKRLE